MRTLLSLLALSVAAPALALTAPVAVPMDYARADSWLCRPGAADDCATADLALTDIGGAAPAAAGVAASGVDCFYVYPTVSRQTTGNADGRRTADETYVVQQQFARFREVCRTYAPLYRQSTLGSIVGLAKPDAELAYGDVRAAWNHYLANDNKGRGVILIGHSQGSRHLKRLIAEEISGKPAQAQLVAAYVIGINVAVPAGKDAGGELGAVPLCRSATQTGCAVAYVSFPAASPPPAAARFGRAAAAGMEVACTNPAALGGGEAAMTTIVPARSRPLREGEEGRQLIPGEHQTPSLRLNGVLRAACQSKDGASYLAVSSPAPAIEAGLQRLVQPDANWGLHVIDVNLAMGDLLRLASGQASAWLAKR